MQRRRRWHYRQRANHRLRLDCRVISSPSRHRTERNTHMAQDSTAALREQLVEAVERLLLAGVMSHSRHGNMSARLPGTEQMLLTSTGLHTSLSAQHIPVVTFDGEVVSGTLDP